VATEPIRYRFGPLERRGLVAGWRGGQIASVAGGLVVAVLTLRSRPGGPGAAVALTAVLLGVALACWPVAGRTGEEWLPIVTRWLATGLSGRRHVTDRPTAGLPARPAKPRGPFAGLELLEVAGTGAEHGDGVGVLRDGREGTATAVLGLRGHTFALLGPDEKDRRVAGWSALLASIAGPGSAVHRLQWIASALPDDGRAVRSHLEERAVLAEDAPARRSYDGLLAAADDRTCRHEVLLAVQVRTTRGRAGRGAVPLLLREVANVRRLCAEVDVAVDRVLDPRSLAAVCRRAGEAGAFEAQPDRDGTAPGHRPAAADRWPWPMALEARWDGVRTDATWHATYWVAEWPRVEVGPDFLGPLLLGTARRVVSVVMAPVEAERAARQVEQARTADIADAELRRRGGFLATARRAKEAEHAAAREAELAEGHTSFRFSGYVTVTALSAEALVDACEVTEQAASQSRLVLRRLYGDQDRAFTYTPPLCRGLTGRRR